MEDITDEVVVVEDLAGVTHVLVAGGAADASEALRRACRRGEPLQIRGRSGPAVELTPAMAELVADFIELAGTGRMVTVIPEDALLTRRQVAAITGFEQPYIYDALTSGKLRSVDVGDECLVRYKDLVRFRKSTAAHPAMC